jgi:hypothetical protein
MQSRSNLRAIDMTIKDRTKKAQQMRERRGAVGFESGHFWVTPIRLLERLPKRCFWRVADQAVEELNE